MLYDFAFFMAGIGELCCLTIIACEAWEAGEEKLKAKLRRNEKFMKWLGGK